MHHQRRDRSLGDYLQVGHDARGAAVVAYVDDTSNAFSAGTGPGAATAETGPPEIARQVAGPSLFTAQPTVTGPGAGPARPVDQLSDPTADTFYSANGSKTPAGDNLDLTGAAIADDGHGGVTITMRVKNLTDHDTAAFAVQTIRRWLDQIGKHAYPDAEKLLVCADGGGSNGHRLRAWKTELAALAAETGLTITVCHLPPGTSKWNKIEHRLFSHISMNWRGRPLTSHQVIVDLIGATTTRTGLKVHAELDNATYPTGIKISDAQLAALPLTRNDFHGDWNYTLRPPDPP